MESDARYFIFTYQFNDSDSNSRNPLYYSGSHDKIYLLWCILYWALGRLIHGKYWYSFWLFRKWLCSELTILFERIWLKIIFEEFRLIYFSPNDLHLFLGISIYFLFVIYNFEENEDNTIIYFQAIDMEIIFKFRFVLICPTIFLQLAKYVWFKIQRWRKRCYNIFIHIYNCTNFCH